MAPVVGDQAVAQRLVGLLLDSGIERRADGETAFIEGGRLPVDVPVYVPVYAPLYEPVYEPIYEPIYEPACEPVYEPVEVER